MTPAVVVLAFNRPGPFRRVLESIANAAYPTGSAISLLLSLDAGGPAEVRQIADEFSWPHGPKRVVGHERHLGLVGHFHLAGAWSQEYRGIILLEDDQVVSRSYYRFAADALTAYAADDRIAGVSLSTLTFNGYNHLPFAPVFDEADVFFLQIPFYVGQAFTAVQWARYEEWRRQGGVAVTATDPLHPLLLKFGPDEWFPERIKYLTATSRYYVYPRQSRATGFGDPGTHFTRPTRRFQVALQDEDVSTRLLPFDASLAVYDAFFEILPDRLRRLATGLNGLEFDVDLYASKPARAFSHDQVLTSRRSRAPLAGFGREMSPLEANVVRRVPGQAIVLSRVTDLRWGRWEDWRVKNVLRHYFDRAPWTALRRLLIAVLES